MTEVRAGLTPPDRGLLADDFARLGCDAGGAVTESQLVRLVLGKSDSFRQPH